MGALSLSAAEIRPTDINSTTTQADLVIKVVIKTPVEL
jgi:hypothetical protein